MESRWIFTALLILTSSCASSRLRIDSLPQGAEITNLKGETIGRTPLALDSSQYSKISEAGFVNFKVSARGYVPRIVIADADINRNIQVSLPTSDTKSFKDEVLKDFGKEMNQMFRRAFAIQRLIMARNFKEARAELEKFKSEYGDLAFAHFMLAHISLSEGKKDEALVHLQRARAADPDDADIAQSLKLLGAKVGGKAP